MEIQVNGTRYEIPEEREEMLIWVLRDLIGLTGSKNGCGIGICGVCTVHVNGQATRACITPVANVVDADIRTIDGLATQNEAGEEILHPVQRAFIEKQAPQCSWCMSGQMMQAAAFLAQNPQPTADEITTAMSNNYCRCAAYKRVHEAVTLAAELMQEEK